MNAVTLTRTGGTAVPEILETRHLDEVVALQEATRAALSPENKMFILPQPAAYFEKLLSRETGLMLGLRAGDNLVAQMALMGPLTLEEASDRGAITRSDVMFHHVLPGESIVVAKSMAVHPQWRGNDLAQHLLQTVLTQSLVRVTDHVFAQISVENGRSWELFLRNGFGIVAAALDPQDGKPRFILQKPGVGFAFHPAASTGSLDPMADFSAIMRLTRQEGLVGLLESSADSAKLAFHARTEMAAAWYDKTPMTR